MPKERPTRYVHIGSTIFVNSFYVEKLEKRIEHLETTAEIGKKFWKPGMRKCSRRKRNGI